MYSSISIKSSSGDFLNITVSGSDTDRVYTAWWEEHQVGSVCTFEKKVLIGDQANVNDKVYQYWTSNVNPEIPVDYEMTVLSKK